MLHAWGPWTRTHVAQATLRVLGARGIVLGTERQTARASGCRDESEENAGF